MFWLKSCFKNVINRNTFINNYVYDCVRNGSVKAAEKCALNFVNNDYLNSLESLKLFQKSIKNNNVMYLSKHINWDNSHIYGIWRQIFGEYCDTSYISPSIEHGLCFHNDVFGDVKDTARMTCATFGAFRKNIIQRNVKIPVFCVGAYIMYARNFYSYKYLNEVKKNYGKTLLVFPCHSYEHAELSVNEKKFIENVKISAKYFNTVLVNSYWWNINDPLIQKLESEGYKIISCGFRDDTNFLRRLKSYFELADLVMGDSIGTHVGYALACGVPFSYVPAETKTKLLLECENKDIDFVEMHQNKIAEAFLNATEITDEQREIVDYYWGNNLFKTKEEIKAIVEINREITDMTYGFTDFRWSAAKKLLKKYADTDEVKYRLLKDAL